MMPLRANLIWQLCSRSLPGTLKVPDIKIEKQTSTSDTKIMNLNSSFLCSHVTWLINARQMQTEHHESVFFFNASGLFKQLNTYCLYFLFVCQMCLWTHAWMRSEGNLRESSLSFHHVGPGIKLMPDLAQIPLVTEASHWPQFKHVY